MKCDIFFGICDIIFCKIVSRQCPSGQNSRVINRKLQKVTVSGKTFFKNLTSGSKCCIIKKLYNKEYDGFVLCPFFFFCPRTRNSGATEAALKFNITILQSGCSAVGSAPALGACDRLMSRPPKARKIFVFLVFSRFSAAVCFGKKLLTTDLTTYGFDRKNRIFSPIGVWRSW